ncbi:hypothetical protein PoB_003289100 [Plakobranchus ocellatus]|uniref:Uncharacterized protein n=1 Tax=Plakobranchus ocellatus TaxID=259542 RepID=A0AAV4A579_9GAST|nr:hypothetical protein PoB_003289100 [Plakobranchus ocellatus]
MAEMPAFFFLQQNHQPKIAGKCGIGDLIWSDRQRLLKWSSAKNQGRRSDKHLTYSLKSSEHTDRTNLVNSQTDVISETTKSIADMDSHFDNFDFIELKVYDIHSYAKGRLVSSSAFPKIIENGHGLHPSSDGPVAVVGDLVPVVNGLAAGRNGPAAGWTGQQQERTDQ